MVIGRRPDRWLLGALLLLGVELHAQIPAGTIRGIVVDKDFNAPLPAVQVVLVETGQKTATTDLGNYSFAQIPPGKYTLVFAKEGYARQVKTDVLVAAGQLTDVDMAMPGDFVEMPEFVVQDALMELGAGSEAALLQLRFESPSLMDSISAELMSRAGASDAAGALRLVAGASVQDGKSAVIRGLPDRYVSSQMNGVRLPTADEDKRAVELDQFPAAVIESIQVTKTFTPDQQGDASGGAVNVKLKGIPNEPLFLRVEGQTGYNSQVTGRSRFLTYVGGGVHGRGKDDGRRDIQYDRLGDDWEGAVGTTRKEAPMDYKWAISGGGKYDLDCGFRIGGFASLFYERDSAFYDNGKDDSYWIETPGGPMTPKAFQGPVQGGDFKTGLFDVTRGQEAVQWGGLGTFGLEWENHALTLVYLYTRTTEDKATLAVDTRGKAYYFPGHDPDDPTTPGHDSPDAAPYLRLETLEYTERTTDTLQLAGRHKLPIGGDWIFRAPEFDWILARSSAGLYQPDKRLFGAAWLPAREIGPITIPATHVPFKGSANFNLGNLQRIWKSIDEESRQFAANLKLPYESWSGEEGYLKFGLFQDQVDRNFDQDTFSNFGDNSTFAGPFAQPWSGVFPFENHPITASMYDVDYRGDLRVSAWYGMLDLPVVPTFHLVGGARFESTEIGIENDAEEDATWFPPGQPIQTKLNPGDADVSYDKDHVLPSLGFVFRPWKPVTLRGSINKTVARQTFKELTPILQQEYLGGPVFIGNPDLKTSTLKNYDLRLDYAPYEGGLVSLSWFRKTVDDPIEYVQRIAVFNFTTAVNYPRGRMSGYEVEVRQGLDALAHTRTGLAVGANATFIESEVTLPEEEIALFRAPNIGRQATRRDMTNAPEYLYNLYLTLEPPETGFKFGVFYTVQGDTLIAGAGESEGNYVPSVYAQKSDTLNLSVSQDLNADLRIVWRAKNLTNPTIKTKYEDGFTKTSHTNGVEYTVSLSGKF